MKIIIDHHTLERAEERGTNEEEIGEVIENGFPISANHGRMAKAKVYNYKQMRHGVFYDQKRVEVVYIIENGIITTVTVYVFYGKWEVENANSI